MKLDEFVAQTLVDVHNGLAKAREMTKRKYSVDSANKGVTFDVAVLANNTTETEAEGKARIGIIEVLGAGVSTKVSQNKENNEASRIQFSVNFPYNTEEEEAAQMAENRRAMEVQNNRDF